MPHRDPETGQFVAGSSHDMAYSDFEFQHIMSDFEFRDAADSGPSDFFSDEDQYNVTERGLDNDELAELTYLRADIALYKNSTGDQTTANFARAETGWGANLAGSEFLNSGGTDESFDSDSSGTDDYTRTDKVTDEAGQWFSERLQATIGYRDTGNSVGAGADSDRVQIEIPFRALYGSGPFLDSTDDITNRAFLDVNNQVDGIVLSQRLWLAWDVDTVEGGRAAFGRPR